eukprot:GHVN01027098.1.p1 GENE.GHVN01027098.1~~GHVN01027098.1.p1  ORF type:complete len:302 (-),score=111.81 GHVN01027098.1:468-1373(-)
MKTPLTSNTSLTSLTSLKPVGESIWFADGGTTPFLGVPYSTRMVLIKLSDQAKVDDASSSSPHSPDSPHSSHSPELWVWSPISITPDLLTLVTSLGKVTHIVAPNKIHHLFLPEWIALFPQARVWAPPGLRQRRTDIAFTDDLNTAHLSPHWPSTDIDLKLMKGSFIMDEVIFHHHLTHTTLIADLIQRFEPSSLGTLTRWLMALDDLLAPTGSTPREWRATFTDRRAARRCLKEVSEWETRTLIVAHGTCVFGEARGEIERSLKWMNGESVLGLVSEVVCGKAFVLILSVLVIGLAMMWV